MSIKKILRLLCCCCCSQENVSGHTSDSSSDNYSEINHAFQYENLEGEQRILKCKGYKSTRDDTHYKLVKMVNEGESSGLGWKLHISLDDTNFENVKKAWNVMFPILVVADVRFMKVVVELSARDQELGRDARGKQVTIYNIHSIINLEGLINQITSEFVRNGISPGLAPSGDRRITGSNYFYYRNDDGGGGTYLAGRQVSRYNASDNVGSNPCDKITVHCTGQPEVKSELSDIFDVPAQPKLPSPKAS